MQPGGDEVRQQLRHQDGEACCMDVAVPPDGTEGPGALRQPSLKFDRNGPRMTALPMPTAPAIEDGRMEVESKKRDPREMTTAEILARLGELVAILTTGPLGRGVQARPSATRPPR